MKQDLKTRYKNIKTKDQYINFYKDEGVATKYAKDDLLGANPQITTAEIAAILNLCKKNGAKMERLLDLACGSARILAPLERQFKSSFGVDSSTLMLKLAAKRVKSSTLKLADIEKLPFKNNYFDVVTGFRFLVNTPKTSRHKMFLEIKRVLKNDGLAILNLHHNKISPRGIKDIVFQERSPKKTISIFGVKKEFQKAGLKIASVRAINIAFLSRLFPFANKQLILKIDSNLSALPINIFGDTIIIAAKKS